MEIGEVLCLGEESIVIEGILLLYFFGQMIIHSMCLSFTSLSFYINQDVFIVTPSSSPGPVNFHWIGLKVFVFSALSLNGPECKLLIL